MMITSLSEFGVLSASAVFRCLENLAKKLEEKMNNKALAMLYVSMYFYRVLKQARKYTPQRLNFNPRERASANHFYG
jgi:hypothetical protein